MNLLIIVRPLPARVGGGAATSLGPSARRFQGGSKGVQPIQPISVRWAHRLRAVICPRTVSQSVVLFNGKSAARQKAKTDIISHQTGNPTILGNMSDRREPHPRYLANNVENCADSFGAADSLQEHPQPESWDTRDTNARAKPYAGCSRYAGTKDGAARCRILSIVSRPRCERHEAPKARR